ncbi:carbohydrate kinase [Aquimarina sp. 2201CG5-10]|uniref:carbohydrate kinase family protein n=1 Tax=Aquimarina callyspongiae TaxID=3098150 RepID=UPI002AB4A404|nr:carbohydrate kinase [Aquimarina sp. 2201CG5-10]MDY8138045.1 carbohydrate kinase [Aquimarina sp. 2201CG5-10]
MKITCFGEVLWDIFPKHKKIGGAPLNVALRLHTMGITSSIITRIGEDDLGTEIVTYIKEQGLSIETIQKDSSYTTGEVLVSLDDEGTASYEISKPVAWDFIESTDRSINEVKSADAIIFGSLASRNKISKSTLFRLLEVSKFKILDVNLRPPHYDSQLLLELMNKADFIKLNDEELDEICDYFTIAKTTIEEQVKAISGYTKTDQICITKGGKGATLFYKNIFYHNQGYKVKVIDTVGAGDSFLATLTSGLLQKKDPQNTIDYACAVGAMVAGSAGANPVFSDSEIKSFMFSNQS